MSKKKETTPVVEAPVAKRGRPVVTDSVRQTKLASRQAKIDAGLSVSKGRPSNPESKRQSRLAAQAAKVAAGGTIKVGRPKSAPVVDVVVKAPKVKKTKAPVMEEVVEA